MPEYTSILDMVNGSEITWGSMPPLFPAPRRPQLKLSLISSPYRRERLQVLNEGATVFGSRCAAHIVLGTSNSESTGSVGEPSAMERLSADTTIHRVCSTFSKLDTRICV